MESRNRFTEAEDNELFYGSSDKKIEHRVEWYQLQNEAVKGKFGAGISAGESQNESPKLAFNLISPVKGKRMQLVQEK